MQINQVLLLGLILLICYVTDIRSHKKECGVLNLDDTNSIPWIANIYQKNENEASYKFICSGTLIARKIILTAAHCFYDDLTQQTRNESYVISVGQKHKSFNSSNDPNVQLREILHDNIIIPDKYNGIATNHINNIAIVKLNKDQKFNITEFVKRACVYWDNDFAESQFELSPLRMKLAVWGNADNAALETLEPSYLDFSTCGSLLPKQFQSFLTFDKMCIQIRDSHLTPSTGSGLYVYDESKNRWYLIGIVSDVAVTESVTYLTAAKMKLHLNWISNTVFLHV